MRKALGEKRQETKDNALRAKSSSELHKKGSQNHVKPTKGRLSKETSRQLRNQEGRSVFKPWGGGGVLRKQMEKGKGESEGLGFICSEPRVGS